ncbi:MAG: tetratricopeptide repeat protein [Deltaproteobacteria bacterium]|nr:tetratricopeptide repeat protein [Deltaproteobacteria bacterium]
MTYLSKILTATFSALILFFPGIATSRYIVRPLDQAVFHNNQGVSYLNAGDAQKALFEFKTATEISPEYAEAWNNTGLAYLFLKQYDQARDSLLRAIKADSDYPAPYNHLATLYYTQGNYDEALKWADKSIKEDKKFSDGYYNKGIILREMARKTGNKTYYAQGEEAFRLATESNSRNYLANFELGNMYKAEGKIEEAMIRYKVALEIQPSASEVWRELGTLYLAKGDNNKAQFAFNKAMEANPNNIDAHLNMGLYYVQEKNYVLAERELTLARQAQPDNPKILFNLAYAKFSQAEDIRGRSGLDAARSLYQASISDYQALLQQVPNYADAAYNLGYAYLRLGDFPNAADWYQKTLAIDANYPRALFGMGALKLQDGDKASAVNFLCRFTKVAPKDLQASIDAAQKIIAENGKCK